MTTPSLEELQERFAEYPGELRSCAEALASANGDGPDPGIAADADDLAGQVVRDADRLDQLAKRADPMRTRTRQAAERLLIDPADVVKQLDRMLARAYDEKTGRPLTTLERLNRLSGEVEFAAEPEQFDNGDWLLQLRGKRPPVEGAVVRVRLTEKQLLAPRDLEDKIRMARCGGLTYFTKSKEDWRAFLDAMLDASEFVQAGGSEANAWHRRLVAYLDGHLAKLDPGQPDTRDNLIENPRPFVHPDGTTWIHVPSFYEALAVRRVNVRNGQVETALGDLGWRAQSLTARIDGRKRQRRFWCSPAGFDPGSDL